MDAASERALSRHGSYRELYHDAPWVFTRSIIWVVEKGFYPSIL